MAKSTTPKTNGHPVPELKAAAPRKTAKAPAASEDKPATKRAAKSAAKPAAKKAAPMKAAAKKMSAARPAAKAPAKSAKAAPKAEVRPAASVDVVDKTRKAKLVRDSFTMPEPEYAVLGQVKKACLKAGFEIKKSELLRIGVALISDLDIATLKKVLDGLPQLKTGRPKSI